MEPIFNVRQQSEIYIGPTADILPGVLPGGRVVVVSDATIDLSLIHISEPTRPY